MNELLYKKLAACLLEGDQCLLRTVAEMYLGTGRTNITRNTLVGVVANGLGDIGISAVALDFLSSAGVPREERNVVLNFINERSGMTYQSGQMSQR